MIQSMTGFGRAILMLPQKKITVEVKSLNSKQLDVSIRIPSAYKEKELSIRSFLSSSLRRGKIELSVFVENIGSESKYIGEVWKAPEYNLLVVSMGIGIISSETVNEDTGIEPIDNLVDNLIPNPTDTTDEKNWNEMIDLIPEIYCYEEDWNA